MARGEGAEEPVDRLRVAPLAPQESRQVELRRVVVGAKLERLVERRLRPCARVGPPVVDEIQAEIVPPTLGQSGPVAAGGRETSGLAAREVAEREELLRCTRWPPARRSRRSRGAARRSTRGPVGAGRPGPETRRGSRFPSRVDRPGVRAARRPSGRRRRRWRSRARRRGGPARPTPRRRRRGGARSRPSPD